MGYDPRETLTLCASDQELERRWKAVRDTHEGQKSRCARDAGPESVARWLRPVVYGCSGAQFVSDYGAFSIKRGYDDHHERRNSPGRPRSSRLDVEGC